MKALVLISLVLMATRGFANCEISTEQILKTEAEVLQLAEKIRTRDELTAAIAPKLDCLFSIQLKGEGEIKYLASSFLRPLMGHPQIKGLKADFRYITVSAALNNDALHSKDILNDSLLSKFADGDWGSYSLFCEQGDKQFCTVFLPPTDLVQNQTPLISAASMLTLRKAYRTLEGKQKEEIAARIKDLYLHIPETVGIRRKVIDEIYFEIFPPQLRLG